MNKDSRILVTGHLGFVGINLCRRLLRDKPNVHVAPADFTLQNTGDAVWETHKPTHVFHLAAQVFGLGGNIQNQAEGFRRNTLINTNVIDACVRHGVEKIVAMGTVAMYPASVPNNHFCESDLWNGPVHDSEWGYANAKRGMLAYLEACRVSYGLKYVCPIATNLYGPHDRFNAATGHVIPSLIRKFYEAKRGGTEVLVWGDGSQTRDFLHVDDVVKGLINCMTNDLEPVINLVSGRSRTIRDAVSILERHTGVKAVYDPSKPSGQLQRSYKAGLVHAPIQLETGLIGTYDWYAANEGVARKV